MYLRLIMVHTSCMNTRKPHIRDNTVYRAKRASMRSTRTLQRRDGSRFEGVARVARYVKLQSVVLKLRKLRNCNTMVSSSKSVIRKITHPAVKLSEYEC